MIIRPTPKRGCLSINGKRFDVDMDLFAGYTSLNVSRDVPVPTIEVTTENEVDEKTIEMFITACQEQPFDWKRVNPFGILELAQAFKCEGIKNSINEYIEGTGGTVFARLNALFKESEHPVGVAGMITDLFPRVFEDESHKNYMLHLPIRTIHGILACALGKTDIDLTAFLKFARDYISLHGPSGSFILSLVRPASLTDEQLAILMSMNVNWDLVNVAFSQCFLDAISRYQSRLKETVERLTTLSTKHSELTEQYAESTSRLNMLDSQLNNRCRELEAQVMEKQTKMTEMERKFEAAISGLTSQLTALTRKCSDLESKASAYEAANATLDARAGAIEKNMLLSVNNGFAKFVDRPFIIRSKKDRNFVLDTAGRQVPGVKLGPGATHIWTYIPNDNQKWTVDSVGRLRSWSNKDWRLTYCNSTQDKLNPDSNPPILVKMSGNIDDEKLTCRWILDGDVIRSMHQPHLVLDISMAIMKDGRQSIIWPYHGGPSQRWEIELL